MRILLKIRLLENLSCCRLIELDRDEIFAVTANILRDRAMKIFAVAPGVWDEEIGARMWKNMKKHVFEDIYFPAALTKDYGRLNFIEKRSAVRR